MKKVTENIYRIIGFFMCLKAREPILLITEMRGECRAALPAIKGFPVFLDEGDN